MKKAGLMFGIVLTLVSLSLVCAVQQESVVALGLTYNCVVTLSFDDGCSSQYKYAWPIMHQKGVVGTFYVVSGWINTNGNMTAQQLKVLFAHGNEIASHSVHHSNFLYLTEAQARKEFADSKAQLQRMVPGLTVKNFAYPGEDGNSLTDSWCKSYYRSARYGPGVNPLPCSNFRLLAGTSGAVSDNEDYLTYKWYVDYAFGQKAWLILFFHNIVPAYMEKSGYDTSTQTFTKIINYIQAKHIPIITLNQALNI